MEAQNLQELPYGVSLRLPLEQNLSCHVFTNPSNKTYREIFSDYTLKEGTIMTNETIIFHHRYELMQEGVLASTGRTIEIETEDGKRLIPEPEEIHTYAAWKALGFQVKRGEHAIATFPIWKHVSKKAEKENEPDEEKMFQTKAFFFKLDQVEPIIKTAP